MSVLRPHERAWIDQQDARLRNAVTIVLDGVRNVDRMPDSLKGLTALNVGAALSDFVDRLDEEEVRALAHHAITRLAQQLYRDGES